MPRCSLDLVGGLRRSDSTATRPDDRNACQAARYIQKLPKAEQDAAEWQAATEALILAAEDRGPNMHARIGMLRALNRHVERAFTDRKDPKWGKRKLRRDE